MINLDNIPVKLKDNLIEMLDLDPELDSTHEKIKDIIKAYNESEEEAKGLIKTNLIQTGAAWK